MVNNVISCINCEFHMDSHMLYRKIIKNMLKSIPKTELINILVELKILHKDFVTREVTISKKFDDKLVKDGRDALKRLRERN